MTEIFHNIDAEFAVLGGLMASPQVYYEFSPHVQMEFFREPKHRAIFAAIQSVGKTGTIPDILTVSNDLLRSGSLQDVGGREYITELMLGASTASAVDSAIKILGKSAARRNFRRIAMRLGELAGDESVEIDDIVSAISKDLTTVTSTAILDRPRPVSHLVERFLDELANVREIGQAPGVKTGFDQIDQLLHGLTPGSIMTIAADTGGGKSALAAQIADQLSRQGKVVAMFPYEMTGDQLFKRLVSSRSHIVHDAIMTGRLTDGEYGSTVETAVQIGGQKLYLLDPKAKTVSYATAVCRQIQAQEQALDLVIFDHIGLMHPDQKRNADNNTTDLVQITAGIKHLALLLKVPVIMLAQFSRGKEGRPQLVHLKGSSSIEQDSDVVCFLHRESDKSRVIEAIIAKNRHGSVGSAFLEFDMPTVTFTEVQRKGRAA